jgi:hypothetical protein
MSKIEQNKDMLLYKTQDLDISNRLNHLGDDSTHHQDEFEKLLASSDKEDLLAILEAILAKLNSELDVTQFQQLQQLLTMMSNNNFNLSNISVTENLDDKFNSIKSTMEQDPSQILNSINDQFDMQATNLTDALSQAITSPQHKSIEQTEFLLMVSVAFVANNSSVLNSIINNNPELNINFKEELRKIKKESVQKSDTDVKTKQQKFAKNDEK